MTRRILVVPTNHGAGLTSVCLGLIHALDEQGVNVGYLKPLAQVHRGRADHTAELVRLVSPLRPPEPITADEIEHDLARGQDDTLMEKVLGRADPILAAYDVVIIEGLVPSGEQTYSGRVNRALAKSLDAEVVLVGSAHEHSVDHMAALMSGAEASYHAGEATRVIGAILTRVDGPVDSPGDGLIDGMAGGATAEEFREGLRKVGVTLVGAVPNREDVTWVRVADLVRELGLTVLNEGDLSRRIRRTSILAQSIPGCLPGLTEGCLVVVPGDRHDVILAAGLAATNGMRLAALLLTANIDPDPRVLALCQAAMGTGLPILRTSEHTFETATKVISMDTEIPQNDEGRARLVMETTAASFDEAWVASLPETDTRRRLSPAAFRRELTLRARRAGKRIVLPEGAEPRTVEAAIHCQEKRIAHCVLLAPRAEVEATATKLGLKLPGDIEIVDPTTVPQKYVDALVERRKHKGMTPQMALENLHDTVVLGTMMVHLGEVDGLVSGAVHTTANTIRPALQILGTKKGARLVSSVFFMGLPDEVVIYGDCAVNPDPNAEELADIAIQSADSATAFGIEPRVAMISYSTGESGSGADVDKVAEATRLVRQQRPDLIIDGPLQYDAATTESVAKSKAPDSPVAGRATVLVFPDLNTGNTTYKAVQRSASVISVGPMLQGIAAPVNDLSRGALVEDIEYTIALTAIQAANS